MPVSEGAAARPAIIDVLEADLALADQGHLRKVKA